MSVDSKKPHSAANHTFVASELARLVDANCGDDIVFVARSDGRAKRVVEACDCISLKSKLVYLPAWDCLPYDRVPPSRASMGMRMDALRDWLATERGGRLCVTSLEAMLQRVPPADVVQSAFFNVAVGTRFDLASFEAFLSQTGYAIDGVVDEPGEVAILKDVVDIFPAGGNQPMRCYLSEEGIVEELWFYDPATQRTQASVQTMLFGPASEVVLPPGNPVEPPNGQAVYAQMFANYGALQAVFDLLKPAAFLIDEQVDGRVDEYLDIIEDARTSSGAPLTQRSLYLDRESWDDARSSPGWSILSTEGYSPLGIGRRGFRALRELVNNAATNGTPLAIAGDEPRLSRLTDRLSKSLNTKVVPTETWQDLLEPGPGIRSGRVAWTEGYIDRKRNLVVVACQDILGPPIGDRRDLAASTLRAPDLQIGDVVVHEEHGVAILRAIETTVVEGVEFDSVRLEYHGGASIIVPMKDFGLLWRYGAEASSVNLDRLNTNGWAKKREDLQQDILSAAKHLVDAARRRSEMKSKPLSPPQDRYQKFAARFPYSLTTDQMNAVGECLADMASNRPMDRLICGDVGFGKTEIALRAAAAAAMSDMQVAVVAPTTILARQHYDVFKKRFEKSGLKVSLLSRAVKDAEVTRTLDAINDGSVDIVIATHSILGKDLSFQRLGLVIIDEEHRFGAADKAAMRALSPNVHVLALSATPIPRTLQSALIGVQDVSLLTTPPARRRPVRTSILQTDTASIRAALLRERRRGGQSFFVAPRVADIAPLQAMLAEIAPELEVLVAHGKMAVDRMEDAVVRFSEGEADILLSTNIIESGLDVPRANTIFVWRSDRFGLAQLHQLRGRVGRGRSQGLAYMLTETDDKTSDDSRQRLSALLKFDRLGSGTDVAMNDLELRGGGSVAGEEQAGHIKVLGTNLYQELLANAVSSVRGGVSASFELPDFEIGVTGYIPSDYVPDPTVRLSFYTRLQKMTSMEEFDELEEEMLDRFGDLAEPVVVLLRAACLRAQAGHLGIASVLVGPEGTAIEFHKRANASKLLEWKKRAKPIVRGKRILFDLKTEADERLAFLETLFAATASMDTLGRSHG
ncbi:helicase-related protein [Rhizobium sp. S152]|uniref:DEAD/DEAH box helicase n=1 Tax=Rhizobium sp. S152 TaxID=3055038 RepID=UPI0025A9565A|nr:DEAD/DEAH box helicase [Rhizobium sp. S152]MDM9627713.1 helicase-related protein [Rhizobium sp. S152]